MPIGAPDPHPSKVGDAGQRHFLSEHPWEWLWLPSLSRTGSPSHRYFSVHHILLCLCLGMKAEDWCPVFLREECGEIHKPVIKKSTYKMYLSQMVRIVACLQNFCFKIFKGKIKILQTTWWSDICMHCVLIITIKLINKSITTCGFHLYVGRWGLLKSALI